MDRIGNLPNEILIHILSFIPTKQAVSTSILSKRWIHLWRSVPILHFFDTKLKTLADNYSFNEFLYSIILFRESASNHSVNSFFLDIEYNSPKLAFRHGIPNVINWINYVVERKVQFLNLYLDVVVGGGNIQKPPNLPISVFTCETLVVLKLNWFSMEEGFSFNFEGFPLLKALHLKKMYFDEYEEFILLLAGCPVLEDLLVSDIKFRSLDLVPAFEFDQVFKSSSLNNLTEVYIRDCYFHFWVKALSNSKFLSIGFWKDYHCNDFPVFHNLTHLVLNYNWDRVVEVLRHCPKLQNLNFCQNMQSGSDEHIIENWVDPESVPHCLSLNLTTCTLWGFALTSLQGDFMLARYILKNARVLQTMKISCVREMLPEIENKLSSCHRASATCQLSFYR
ncbi:putative FBD-associated F-box protein At5g56440 [Trifolium pratense]|uniref:putative FBD-associated F-box protein At5g56440 n=1 Tax=Trifolium pratense TaxID=57577 RepID=UPI001E69260F|nr:putative FBD-associated F-box protein At5g56440 [Trifolium pratense]